VIRVCQMDSRPHEARIAVRRSARSRSALALASSSCCFRRHHRQVPAGADGPLNGSSMTSRRSPSKATLGGRARATRWCPAICGLFVVADGGLPLTRVPFYNWFLCSAAPPLQRSPRRSRPRRPSSWAAGRHPRGALRFAMSQGCLPWTFDRKRPRSRSGSARSSTSY